MVYRYVLRCGDESTDDEYELWIDGRKTDFSIQDGRSYGGDFSLNHYLYDKNGEVSGVEFLETAKSLLQAKQRLPKLVP